MDPRLIDSLVKHEGYRSRAYQDSEGIWTIGYGQNLQILEIDEYLARKWLLEGVEKAERYAKAFPEWGYLDTDARRNVFIEMIYNMGPKRVSGFRNTLAAIRDQDWEEAAVEMLDSKWARQVGRRARTLSELMKNGHYAE